MRYYSAALLSLSLAALSTGAHAAVPASDLRMADEAVSHQAKIAREAVQSGDVATIAVERAKLQAAQAAAWGKRHPAQAPAEQVAVK